MSGYAEIIAGREGLYVTRGRVDATQLIPLPEPTLGAAVAKARTIAPAVLWVHESAHALYGLPESGHELGSVMALPPDAASSPGWVRLAKDLHLALPAYSGDFAELEAPIDLLYALRQFAEHVGMQFMFSAPSTVLALIGAKMSIPLSQPSGVPYIGSAFAIPAHTWTRPADAADRGLPAVQLFDRRASYLAAWRSAVLPVAAPGAAAWLAQERPNRIAAPGYYLIDVRALAPFLARERLYNPFARAHGEELEGAVWLTEPLATLALELAAEAGVTLECGRAVTSTAATRALDLVAERLGDARKALEAGLALGEDPRARAVIAAIKDGYTRGTAHLEFGRKPGHALHRPEWRHSIVDRSVANTYRSLRRASRRPLVMGGIDAAVFPVITADLPIDGLREGPELGTWHRRGAPMPRAAALRKLGRKSRDTATNARELIAALMAS